MGLSGATAAMFWARQGLTYDARAVGALQRCRFKLDFGLDAASVTMVERMEKLLVGERYLARSRRALQHANAIGLPTASTRFQPPW